MKNSVGASTDAKYLKTEGLWREFLKQRECAETFLQGFRTEDKRKVVILFITWLREREISISNTMAGLHHLLRSHLRDTGIFRDESILAARRATLPTGREISLLQEERYRYPISFDMVEWLREQTWLGGDIDERMTTS